MKKTTLYDDDEYIFSFLKDTSELKLLPLLFDDVPVTLHDMHIALGTVLYNESMDAKPPKPLNVPQFDFDDLEPLNFA